MVRALEVQWISFVLPTQNVPISASSLDLFTKMLSNHPSFITQIYDYERSWMAYNTRKTRSVEIFGKRYQVMLDAPVVLCRERFELTLEELEKADFESQRASEVIPGTGWMVWAPDILRETRPLEIGVAIRECDNNPNLEELIESIAVSSEMEKVYAGARSIL